MSEAARREADAERVWLNVADKPELCDFFSAALVRQGDLTIAISTDGASPALARRIREDLKQRFGPEYGAALERLREVRDLSRAGGQSVASRRDAIEQVVGALPLEKPVSPGIGKVFLIGAGPGDLDLITVKGRRCLEQAEVVVYDALVDRRLLELSPASTRLVYVGKRDLRHTLPQAEINSILIEEAHAGRTVVRLKGGDPFIFGRGGEEAQALAAAGVPYEVVPGVSAGVAVPAYAGIPLTHRDFTSELVFLTGHERAGGAGCVVDWSRYGRTPASLVIFMGLHNLQKIASALLEHGRDPSCPVAVIERGTTKEQRTVVAPLSKIISEVAAAGLEAPALIVVGEVVRLREALRWFEEKAPEVLPRA